MYDEDIREELFFFLEEHFGKCRVIEEKVTMKLTQSQVGIYFGNYIIRVRTKLCFLIL